ncbi:MAG TPA: ATP-binding protein [Vicinamibacterales bacterium]|nr:ATP-binding protein [Vicinamibacterales bacterium]
MRLSIRVKQIVGVTAIVGLVVVALSALFTNRLANVVLQESLSRGELLANTILHRAGGIVTGDVDPTIALRDDLGLRSILESSIYGDSVSFAAIVDTNGTVIVHNNRAMVGRTLAERADLEAVIRDTPMNKLRMIFAGDGQTLEVRETLKRGGDSFGSIRIGLSTLLMRRQLRELLYDAGFTGAAALAISVFVAGIFAQLLLRPIHVLRSGLTRLGKGEFGVTLDMPGGDEFGELGDFFNTVSQQLSADRSLLAGQKANLQSAVEHLEDAVALFNPSGELLFSNPAMQHTLPADSIGRVLDGLLPIGHPYRTLVEETLATRKSRGPIQIQGHPTEPVSVPGRDTGSIPRNWVSALAPQKQETRPGADDELVVTHAIAGMRGELVGVLLVSRNLAHLSRMQSTLAYSRKLVQLGRLTAGIAHEVKNPLNAMMIHLELLRTKVRGLATTLLQPEAVGAAGGTLGLGPSRATALPVPVQGALEHVEIIESEIRRLDEVVQGFLKFTRPEDLRLQPVRVAGLFEEILPIIETEASKNGVRVATDVSVSTPNVNGDAAMLRQAFLNLAINACQAMPQGGSLRVVARPASRQRVEIRIEDTGVGIKPEHLSRIFDLYFTTKERGTGIGLSMVYRIIQMHDGEVDVQSTPGRGTTFRVLLPRANGA